MFLFVWLHRKGLRTRLVGLINLSVYKRDQHLISPYSLNTQFFMGQLMRIKKPFKKNSNDQNKFNKGE